MANDNSQNGSFSSAGAHGDGGTAKSLLLVLLQSGPTPNALNVTLAEDHGEQSLAELLGLDAIKTMLRNSKRIRSAKAANKINCDPTVQLSPNNVMPDKLAQPMGYDRPQALEFIISELVLERAPPPDQPRGVAATEPAQDVLDYIETDNEYAPVDYMIATSKELDLSVASSYQETLGLVLESTLNIVHQIQVFP
ncbi:unnamed protein product [Fusarium fujikuroi]|nr:unnamed protein product [Fusarium fujikuroi]